MRRALLVLLALLAVGLGGAFWFRDALVLAALDPGVPFDPAAAPPAPDYADPAAWSALPEREDAADAAPVGLPAADQAAALVDVFYVHPTTYVGPRWNGPVGDPALDAATDAVATRIQASAFNACCAVFAPRYRQANGRAFVRPGPDGDRALDLAYGDVRAAFRAFRARRAGRPFVLASHSQGTALAARLLREEIAGAPDESLLVAAYLVGGPVTADALGVPPCDAPEQTGCAVAWNARGPHHEDGVFAFHSDGTLLCVNPLTWRRDEVPAPAARNEGAVFLHAGDGRVLPHFADARCRGGLLVVSEIGDAPRDLASRVLDRLLGPENYHPIEYQLFYANLRRNAQARAEAYLGSDAIAQPLP